MARGQVLRPESDRLAAVQIEDEHFIRNQQLSVQVPAKLRVAEVGQPIPLDASANLRLPGSALDLIRTKDGH